MIFAGRWSKRIIRACHRLVGLGNEQLSKAKRDIFKTMPLPLHLPSWPRKQRTRKVPGNCSECGCAMKVDEAPEGTEPRPQKCKDCRFKDEIGEALSTFTN